MNFGCWRQWSIPWQLSQSKIKNSTFKIRWMPMVIEDISLATPFHFDHVNIDWYDQWRKLTFGTRVTGAAGARGLIYFKWGTCFPCAVIWLLPWYDDAQHNQGEVQAQHATGSPNEKLLIQKYCSLPGKQHIEKMGL